MGFNYMIAYKKGVENKVTDALFRQFEEEATSKAISALQTSWMAEIHGSWEGDELVQQLIAKLIVDSQELAYYT